MNGTMKLFLHNDHWFCRYGDPEIKSIFGTDTIPTPWFGAAKGVEVIEFMREKHPDAVVTFA